jgi:S-methylmethionine-dependent homocysteine/selenocysteine methylase
MLDEAITLPQCSGECYLMDGGMETTLIFHEGVTLRDFASFELMETAEGRNRLAAYYRRHADIAAAQGAGFIFDSPTWRASRDWGVRLGYTPQALADLNRRAIDLMHTLRDEYAAKGVSGVVSGCVGPRGDGYKLTSVMSADQAQAYHAEQIDAFAAAGADMASAMTMNYRDEAIGVALAAKQAGLPVAIAFTLETDGRLPSGDALGNAIRGVDAASGNGPAYYMINCAHPTHFADMLKTAGDWKLRIQGVRANASKRSHAELDNATDIDDGNPAELGAEYRALRTLLPRLNVLGGCCGTDHRHVAAIGAACRG